MLDFIIDWYLSQFKRSCFEVIWIPTCRAVSARLLCCSKSRCLRLLSGMLWGGVVIIWQLDIPLDLWQGRVHGVSLGVPRPKAESGMGFLGGRGWKAPSPPARGPGERCELQRDSGRSPDCPKVFHYFQHSWWPLLTL